MHSKQNIDPGTSGQWDQRTRGPQIAGAVAGGVAHGDGDSQSPVLEVRADEVLLGAGGQGDPAVETVATPDQVLRALAIGIVLCSDRKFSLVNVDGDVRCVEVGQHRLDEESFTWFIAQVNRVQLSAQGTENDVFG
ncbi:hypothetical protein BG28_02420 [Nesterenkonia sp. AN1]|nr:hypothetical protein BG28_02420 [Nesterenkonia sp. AN1]